MIPSAVTATSLTLTVMALPAPMSRVNTPTVPPPVRPLPAVTPVVALEAMLAVVMIVDAPEVVEEERLNVGVLPAVSVANVT